MYSVYLHVVFSTKNRALILTENLKEIVFGIFKSVAGNHHSYILACNGMEDHVHILIKVKLNENVSEIVKEMKRLSSSYINKQSDVKYFYWQHHYAVFSVSKSICPNVIRYIDNQQIHHNGKSYLNEMEQFANKSNESLDFDFYE